MWGFRHTENIYYFSITGWTSGILYPFKVIEWPFLDFPDITNQSTYVLANVSTMTSSTNKLNFLFRDPLAGPGNTEGSYIYQPPELNQDSSIVQTTPLLSPPEPNVVTRRFLHNRPSLEYAYDGFQKYYYSRPIDSYVTDNEDNEFEYFFELVSIDHTSFARA